MHNGTQTQMAPARDRAAGLGALTLQPPAATTTMTRATARRPPRSRSSRPARPWPSSRRPVRSIEPARRAAVRAQQPADRRGRGLRRRPATTSPTGSGPSPCPGEATSDNRIPLPVDGTIDLILSTMTITEERDLEIDFSELYYVANGDVPVPGTRHPEPRRPERQHRAHGARIHLSGDDQGGGAGCRPAAGRPVLGVLDQVQTGRWMVSTDNVILTGMVIQDDARDPRSSTTPPSRTGSGSPRATPR